MVQGISSSSIRLISQLQKTQKSEKNTLKELATGKKQDLTTKNVMSLVKSENITAALNGLERSELNITNATGLLGTAQGGLEALSAPLQEMHALAIQGASDLISDSERQSLDERMSVLKQDIDRIAKELDFNGVKLLDGSFASKSIQVGSNAGNQISIDLSDATASGLGINNISLNSATSAGEAITLIQDALGQISQTSADIGSVQNRLDVVQQANQKSSENLAASKSSLSESDVSEAVVKLKSLQILKTSATLLLGQEQENKGNFVKKIL